MTSNYNYPRPDYSFSIDDATELQNKLMKNVIKSKKEGTYEESFKAKLY